MDVSACKECRGALKRALLKGLDPSKMKLKDGHLEGCPSLKKEEPDAGQAAPQEEYWPWAVPQQPPNSPVSGPGPAESGQHGGGFSGDGSQGSHPAGGPGRRAQLPPSPPAGRGQRSDRPVQHRGRARVHGNGYAEAAAAQAQKPERVQQVKVVQHADRGEQKDNRKAVWFVLLVVIALLTMSWAPPIALACVGGIVMLFAI